MQDAVVTPGLANVHNAVDLAKLASKLEDVATATYLNGIQNALQNPSAIKVATSIQPVEMQHSAILHFVLGDYPVPDTFAKTDGAAPRATSLPEAGILALLFGDQQIPKLARSRGQAKHELDNAVSDHADCCNRLST